MVGSEIPAMLVIPIAERNNDFWQQLHIHNRGRLTNVVLNEVGIEASHSASRVVIGLSRLKLRTPAARQMAQKALQGVCELVSDRSALPRCKKWPRCAAMRR